MKKSMINFITLAVFLINFVLTILLTFSLVSTNNRTNNLIKKVGEIIDLDAAGNAANGSQTGSAVNIDDIEYVEVKSGDSTNITVSYTDSGKTHYVVFKVTLGLNKKAKDYSTKSTSINNGMKLIVSQITNEALKYSYNTVTTNKTTIEKNLLSTLQDQFETEAICSVTLSEILVQ